MKKIVVNIQDEEKEETLLEWLKEQDLGEFQDYEPETDIVEKQAKKTKILAAVSMVLMVALGGFSILQMTENTELKQRIDIAKKESEINRQIAERVRDSLVTERMDALQMFSRTDTASSEESTLSDN